MDSVKLTSNIEERHILYEEPESYESHEKAVNKNRDIEGIQEHFRGKYQVMKRLGKGTQGAVFLAEDVISHRKVAIKQLNIASVKDWKKYDLFHREAATLQRLDIPGIAKLVEVQEFLDISEPCAFIIQEYIDGEPLQAFIARGHRFQIGQIGALLLQLLNIVEKLHHSDPPVIHRDIKPSNILVNYTENSDIPEVHLIDFGAVSNPQVKSGGSTVVGTYGYMAPEQLMGHSCPASDIYSLGIVAVYLLSGVPPEELEIQDFHVLIDSHLEHLPHQVTGFLRSMLAPKVEERLTDYDKIRQFFRALQVQKFEDIPETKMKFKPARELTFEHIDAYLQSGNIELWQSLSDKTPRKIPSGLKKAIIKHGRDEKKYMNSEAISSDYTSIKEGFYADTNSFLFSINGMLLLVFPLFLSLICILFLGKEAGDVKISLQCIWGACLILFVYIKLAFFVSNFIKYLKIRSFFVNARKSMATVIRIEYCDLLKQDKLNKKIMRHTAYYPTWKLTYSFNPPDDESPDPLVRTVITKASIEGLKEGSLIPILYLIKRDKLGRKCVLSTPFPIPTCDSIEFSEK